MMSAAAEPDTLLTALHGFQEDAIVLGLSKDAKGQVGNQKYTYLTIGKLKDAAQPLLTKHKLVWQTFPTTLDGEPALRYKLSHVPSGEYDEDVMPLMLDKPTSQMFGSAQTYARRYSFTAALDLVADSDDDGAKASDQPTTIRTPAPRKPEDRLLKPEELAQISEAVTNAGKTLEMAAKAVGKDDPKTLTEADGWNVLAKIEARGASAK